jgi:hypothetical protein
MKLARSFQYRGLPIVTLNDIISDKGKILIGDKVRISTITNVDILSSIAKDLVDKDFDNIPDNSV